MMKIQWGYCYIKPSSKKRRHSGWCTERSTIKMNRQDMLNECLEPKIYYDDWEDWRDGMRHNSDKSMIRKGGCCLEDDEKKKYNNKHCKLTKRRKAMKKGRSCLHSGI